MSELKPARLKRRQLIEEFECLRQGFCSVIDLVPLDPAQMASMQAYHRQADRMVVLLGGESVCTPVAADGADCATPPETTKKEQYEH